MRRPIGDAIAVFILFVSLAMIIDSFRGYDSTDDKENGERSGMALYIDRATGCNYVGAGLFGGLTPRVDGYGGVVGCNHKPH